MIIGYSYLSSIWLSVEDCQEIALSVFEEQVYIYAMRRLQEGQKDWLEKANKYQQRLLHTQSVRKWKAITVFE